MAHNSDCSLQSCCLRENDTQTNSAYIPYSTLLRLIFFAARQVASTEDTQNPSIALEPSARRTLLRARSPMPRHPAASVNVRQLFDNLTLTPPPLNATVAHAPPNHCLACTVECNIGTVHFDLNPAHSAPHAAKLGTPMYGGPSTTSTNTPEDRPESVSIAGGRTRLLWKRGAWVTRAGMLLLDNMRIAWYLRGEAGKKNEWVCRALQVSRYVKQGFTLWS
jgi:hypothetical protein